MHAQQYVFRGQLLDTGSLLLSLHGFLEIKLGASGMLTQQAPLFAEPSHCHLSIYLFILR